MHEIEPYSAWLDPFSPFFGAHHDPYLCRNVVYNYYIHPAWDEVGSTTLYVKLLYAGYPDHFAIIELIGEWNDTLYNDIMFLTRNLLEPLMERGINRFALVGENILNFHAGDDDYYQELSDNLEDGWIACINFRQHVRSEFQRSNLDYYLLFGGGLDQLSWRRLKPLDLMKIIDALVTKRLSN